ncbi:hypothetical protein FACS1894153_1610 [Bacteroidia bacterium]|nr:hypothetical protein FACS1894153_1610 [Bacteroidia bacterium]
MKTKISIILVLAFCSNILFAQGLKTNYFLDAYSHNHLMNPALSPNRGYVYIPCVNFNLGLNGNMKISQFLYMNNGSFTTALNPDISAKTFLSKLHNNNHLDFDISDKILAAGFYIKNMFFSLDLGINANVGLNIPKDFFSFLKKQMYSQNTHYNFKNFALKSNAYADLGLGFAMDIDEHIRVGGKLKILAGLANASLNVTDWKMNMTGDEWSTSIKSEANIMGNGITYDLDSNGNLDLSTIGFDISKLGVAGWGGAIDLGAQYSFGEESYFNGLRVSLGITDLGFINYGKDASHRFTEGGSVKFVGINNIGVSDSGTFEMGSIDNLIDDLVDDVYGLMDLKADAPKGKASALSTKIAIGAEYSFVNNTMGIGVLFTSKISKFYSINELTLSYNLHPSSWFGLALSTSFVQSGLSSIGWSLNLAPNYGLNLFLGMDYVPFTYMSNYLPYETGNVNISVGLCVPLGKKASLKKLKEQSVEVMY